MSHATNLGCRWFEEVWNQRNPDAITALTPADMRAHGADGTVRGQAEFRQFYDMLVQTVPDLRIEIVNYVQGEGHVAVQWLTTGTHTGALDGWPPTGRAISVAGLTLMRVLGDSIIEAWDSFDMAGLLRTMNAPV